MKLFFFTLFTLSSFFQNTCQACFREVSKASIDEARRVFEDFPYRSNVATLVRDNGEYATAFLITPRLALLNLHSLIDLKEGERTMFLANEEINFYYMPEDPGTAYRKTLEEVKISCPKNIAFIKRIHPLSSHQFLTKKDLSEGYLALAIPESHQELAKTYKQIYEFTQKHLPSSKEEILSLSSAISGIACSFGKRIKTRFDLALVELSKPLKDAQVVPLENLLPKQEDFENLPSELPGTVYARTLPAIKRVSGKIVRPKKIEPINETTSRGETMYFSLKTMVKREGKRFFTAEYISSSGEVEDISPSTYSPKGPQKALSENLLAGSIIGGWSGAPLWTQRADGSLLLLGFTSFQGKGALPSLEEAIKTLEEKLYQKEPKIYEDFKIFIEQKIKPQFPSENMLIDVFEALTKKRLKLIQETMKAIGREVLRKKGLDTESFLKKILGENYEKASQLKLLPQEEGDRIIQEIEANKQKNPSKSS